MDGLGRRIDIDTTSPPPESTSEPSNITRGVMAGSRIGLGVGGATIGGSLGSRAGYYMGDEYGGGRLVGGAVGSATGAALGLAAIPAGKFIGKQAINSVKNMDFRSMASNTADFVTNTAKAGVSGVSSALGTIGKAGLHTVSGYNAEGVIGSALSPVRTGIHAVNKIARGAFVGPDKIESVSDLSKVRLSGYVSGAKKAWNETSGNRLRKAVGAARGSVMSGQSLLFGAAAVKGAKSAIDTAHSINQGTRMEGIYTNTPAIPQYDDNSGATGDLVFALHRLRGGGR